MILYIQDSYFQDYTFQLLNFSYLIGSYLKNTELAKRTKIREKRKKQNEWKNYAFLIHKSKMKKERKRDISRWTKINWLNINMITKNRQIKVCLWAIKKFLSYISEKWPVKCKQLDKFYDRSTVASYTSIPPRWNSPCRGEGAYPPRSSNQCINKWSSSERWGYVR